ncbi:MAG: 16S rRNA (cytosine(1402)-N(4))-methyltransferase RsmH [Armatimonadota bacterium]
MGGDAPYHIPAMAGEVLDLLEPANGGLWLDCTVGGGGHAALICARLGPDATLLGIDRDPLALEAAAERLKGCSCRVALERGHFSRAGDLVDRLGGSVSGALWDLGVSSHQLDRGTGFSIRDLDAPLDMRQDPQQDLCAADIVNRAGEKEIADILFRNSDERFSRRIAARIVRARPLRTVGDLMRCVDEALPAGYRTRDDVKRRVAQALRMEVNRELQELRQSLEAVCQRLVPGGRAVVLSYHSGEDRLVKQFFRRADREGWLRVLTPRPLRPSEEECRRNPRARPARLRAAERVR